MRIRKRIFSGRGTKWGSGIIKHALVRRYIGIANESLGVVPLLVYFVYLYLV